MLPTEASLQTPGLEIYTLAHVLPVVCYRTADTLGLIHTHLLLCLPCQDELTTSVLSLRDKEKLCLLRSFLPGVGHNAKKSNPGPWLEKP